MEVDDEEMKHLMHHDLKNLKLKKLTKTGAKSTITGGIDITPLRNLVKENMLFIILEWKNVKV